MASENAAIEPEISVQANHPEFYEDSSAEQLITKKDLNKMVWRSLLLQASFNYERMQAAGWLYSILPGLKKVHKNKHDLSESMKSHMEFFNTHPFLVNIIMGIVLAMEERKQNRNTIRAIRVAMMGPLGGIGDALFWLTLLPICVGIGASLGADGNPIGALVFLIIFNVVHFGLRFGLMRYGYHAGTNAISSLKENTKKVSHAASIVGLTVVGGLIASFVQLKANLVIHAGKAEIALQEDLLDKIMPNMLPLGYTLLMYYLLKRGLSPVILILITVVIGIIGKIPFPFGTIL
ncbi:PTS system mannose/fructose/sorbose family transporter subunit IID [Cytobacillus firmus]|uniref:PTS system mannose/fructose/sorbose family transporter subunit IID n=1 Tax=Cytobacillus firmus TaxID=1399 RepID=UPI0024941395|nr:PTS system mannose/fructose/sorbose family transporter subunit IID [Cytobacillus firmus]